MEHLAGELDCGWLVGVLLREIQLELEEPTLPRGFINAFNGGRPSQQVTPLRRGDDIIPRLILDAFEVFEQPALCGS